MARLVIADQVEIQVVRDGGLKGEVVGAFKEVGLYMPVGAWVAPGFLFEHAAHADKESGFFGFENVMAEATAKDPARIKTSWIVKRILDESFIVELPFPQEIASGVEVAKVHHPFVVDAEVVKLGHQDIGVPAGVIHQVDIKVKGKKVGRFVLRSAAVVGRQAYGGFGQQVFSGILFQAQFFHI